MNRPHEHLFSLRILGRFKGDRPIIIHAYDKPALPSPYGHCYIDIEVRQAGKVIFPRGQLYCGVNAYTTTDGPAARAAAIRTAAMRIGDTDREYFAGYTDAQLDWAYENGEYLSWIAEERYGQH